MAHHLSHTPPAAAETTTRGMHATRGKAFVMPTCPLHLWDVASGWLQIANLIANLVLHRAPDSQLNMRGIEMVFGSLKACIWPHHFKSGF